MQVFVYLSVLLTLILTGCATPPPQTPAYQFEPPQRQLDYLKDVTPVLVKRCVVCHSCYNSPCQLKLSSWEGLDRGASKEKIYNGGRLKTMEPSRLFVDAHNTTDWRKKGFFNVKQEGSQNYDESMLYQLLDHKRTAPRVAGEYFPEADDLTCSENPNELKKYLKKHPNRGMPFGFPPLSNDDFNTVVGWLIQGAQGPSPEQQIALESIPNQDQKIIDKWEKFLNRAEPKYRVTARYLYDHLFLAHITFNTDSNEFYEIVRSKTGPGEKIDIIATVRPYDDPETDQFYYRFRKIYSTIVYKTHMVFPLGEVEYERVRELFITPEWTQPPHLIGYDKQLSANPFAAYEQIPARSRYQWLLDNAQYIIMTFIRGPVCKGQVALNVIDDHFWLMFLDPDFDLSVKYPGFLKLHFDNLRMPGEKGSDYKLYKALLKNKHYKSALDYYAARQQFYGAHYPDGLGIDAIWPGNKPDDQPVMTVFRHFDSASVHRGVLGKLPKTMWVVDYPLLERIYYALVAGFDIYGTAGHQLATRLYMDELRIEGESYFLDFMPREKRQTIMKSWYLEKNFDPVPYSPAPIQTGTPFLTDEPKREFIEQVVKTHIKAKGIDFGKGYLPAGEAYPDRPLSYAAVDDYITGFLSVSAPGVSFFRHVADHNANVAWVRIKNISGGEDIVVSMVINHWHDSVRFLFLEGKNLDPNKDSVDFIGGFIGAYPNYFFVVDFSDLPDFFDILDNYDGSESYIQRLAKYGINRAQDNFWEVYDWFQNEFNKAEGQRAGLIDLNRYYYLATEQ